MKISVVMAVYNGGERMRCTIDSVLNQTWHDLEFVCIDDGSTDDISGRILDEYAAKDSRMIVLHRANRGVAETLNECHNISKGDFIARVDQDDVLHPQLLEYCVTAINKYDLDFVAFRYGKMSDGVHIKLFDVNRKVDLLVPWDDEKRILDSVEYCNTLGIIHTDSWSHCVRKQILIDYPIDQEWGRTRLFQRLHASRRWVATRDVLYFYNDMVATSMTHQNLTMHDLVLAMKDIGHLHDFYAGERESGDISGEWELACNVYLIRCLKETLNKIRRAKGKMPNEDRNTLAREFSVFLYEFFVKKGVPFRYVKLRHKIPYIWLMFKYRNYIKEQANGK